MRWAHARLQSVSHGADLRRLRSLRPVLHTSHELVHARDVLAAEPRVRTGRRRMRRSHRELRDVHRASNVRRLRDARPMLRQLRVHALDLRRAEHRMRTGGRWLRQPHPERLRYVPRGSDLRRLRGSGSVLRRDVHAKDVRRTQHHLRARRRRLRQPHPDLRNMHASGDLRRRRHAGSVPSGRALVCSCPDAFVLTRREDHPEASLRLDSLALARLRCGRISTYVTAWGAAAAPPFPQPGMGSESYVGLKMVRGAGSLGGFMLVATR